MPAEGAIINLSSPLLAFQLPPCAIHNRAARQVWDAIVVGAGIAGSALAFKLGSEGRRVLLLERDLTEPDRCAPHLAAPLFRTPFPILGEWAAPRPVHR